MESEMEVRWNKGANRTILNLTLDTYNLSFQQNCIVCESLCISDTFRWNPFTWNQKEIPRGFPPSCQCVNVSPYVCHQLAKTPGTQTRQRCYPVCCTCRQYSAGSQNGMGTRERTQYVRGRSRWFKKGNSWWNIWIDANLQYMTCILC